jgi:hypothetical protein
VTATGAGAFPLCFVLMPFGTKRDAAGGVVEFDEIYDRIIKPAVEAAGMHCVPADEERVGGIIHKPMFERLLLCDYAVADLTTANPNVFYELGIRHATRPWSTILTHAAGFHLPFDVRPLRGVRYSLDDSGLPDEVERDRAQLESSLEFAKHSATDSPLFQLLDEIVPPRFGSLDVESFRRRVADSERVHGRLAAASGTQDLGALGSIVDGLGDLQTADAGVLVELLLSYRAVKAWEDMVWLAGELPEELARTPLVREQVALALNRLGRGYDAERSLLDLIEERGPSSETYGILGRIYKDRWVGAQEAGDGARARGLLDKAIAAYLKGFETDWRDAYPGINAVQLIWLRDRHDRRLRELLPVVAYSARQRMSAGGSDYWDFATLLELAIYDGDLPGAVGWLDRALASDPTPMQAESTLESVRRLRAVGDPDATSPDWDELERELAAAARSDTGSGG